MGELSATTKGRLPLALYALTLGTFEVDTGGGAR
jgi:hypothetical protein